MKILVLGASGMAGHLISLYFQEKGYDVIGVSRKRIDFIHNNQIGDATDNVFLTNLLMNHYDVIINCIGILNTDAENNKSKSVFINSYLPHLIVDAIGDRKIKFIQMSTDCVFEGNTGPYREDSFPNGKTFYDRTKALGEINANRHLTFRNSIVGPDINKDGIGLFNWFMSQKNIVTGYAGAFWSGVTTLTLAKAMEKAIEEDLMGVYNLTNNKSISKYDLLHLFNKQFRLNSIDISKDDNLKLDKTLISTRSDFSFVVPSYEQMISEMREWVLEHIELYNYQFS
jgi:dTDP-4-dehydrorhamnose reductase